VYWGQRIKVKAIDKTIIAIGGLDLGYIAWFLWNTFTSETRQLSTVWEGLVTFGLPFPQLQFGAIVLFYVSILVCGLAMVSRCKKLAWLNYAQFPVRLLVVVPTLYPVFFLLSKFNVELSFVATMLVLGIIELGRVAVVYRWCQSAT
jgi:hypothetical protein